MRLKKQKLAKKANVAIQCVIHSILVIILLSVWDIADVYQYFRMHSWDKSNMNILLTENTNYGNFIQTLNNMSQISYFDSNKFEKGFKDLEKMKKDASFKGTIVYFNSYINNYDDNFYQHFFEHNQQHVESLNAPGKQFTTTTKIKALFVIKIHSQIISDFLVILFTILVLVKLKSIESLVDWDPRVYLLKNYLYQNDLYI